MSIEIRRTLTWVQTTYEEGGKSVPVPTKLVSAIAIIKKSLVWPGLGREPPPRNSRAWTCAGQALDRFAA